MIKPRRALALATLLVLAAGGQSPPAVAADNTLEEVLVTQVEGLVVVDTDGSVADLRVATPLSGDLGPALEARLRALRFVPVTIGGQPSRARTAFVVALSARQKPGGGLTVAVDGIDFFAPKDAPVSHADGERPAMTGRMMMPPRLPASLMQAHVAGGGVDVAVRFGADGKVEDAAITRSYVSGNRGGTLVRKLMREFDQAALDAARKWQADLPAGGAPLGVRDRTTRVLITYYTVESAVPYGRKGVWVPVQRTAKHPVPWLAGDAADASDADRIATAGGSAPSGAFKLVSPLAGTPVM